MSGDAVLAAAVREVYEELGVQLDIGSLRELIRVEDQAYGGAPGDIVSLVCFGGTADGVLRAGDEIAQVAWLAQSEWYLFAPAVQKALAQLAGGA
ncbi:MAG: NUDIX domain-containing protein [Actinobacteria bacterium]|nr:NUDIX domain-containing protein [Actinomycetota bacterium]MBO0834312.1 NUDIX domain-containing protein [Actinomycetota bacterium]